MGEDPENLVPQWLRAIRADIARLDEKIDTEVDEAKADLRSEINSLRADVASDFIVARAEISGPRKETHEQISGLRRAVMEYPSSVIGQGMPISELEARARRVELHLDLPAMDSH